MTKMEIITCKIEDCFVEFSSATLDVDFLACFDVILLEKKACNAIAIPEKKLSVTSL